ncbi:CPBP family intramembrane glutamic endopeptidase [Streptomyces olivochromogenes]|uniref:CPBP family intramembrane glutamic endopeptidase n=1 Tax=Streptomyces olivochromogenes TaxID=1963 RepID=UPI001F4911EA|nr:CPBP family intramembrane glutamic endopeptidase [Streptomyces olivochromogenes]MCF3134681.1 CPBP family intramembrane metalloprotease [Streptomyces olivochromogenes]
MWSHTRSLEGLMLVATVAPAELVRIAGSFGSSTGRDRSRARTTATVGVPAAYLVVTGLALAVVASGHLAPDRLIVRFTGLAWLVIAIGTGVGLVAAEFALGAVPKLLRGTRIVRLSVQAPAGPGYLTSILITAVAEELLYRGLWIGTLEQRLHLPAWSAICCAAVGYALGHLYFGGLAVLQKTLSGVVFGLLLVASGSLLAPVLAHLGQNLAVHALAERQGRRR